MRKKRGKNKILVFLLIKSVLLLPVIFLLLFLMLYFMPFRENVDCFQTLNEVVAYAHSMPEYPKPDNKNLLKPDYTSFYRKHLPSVLDKIKFFIGIKRHFTASFFKKILISITKRREAWGYKGNFILKLTPPQGSHFIVWGDLQGAFHSLVRDLQKLNELGFINNDLSLKNEDDFIVFMGDAISRSPYTMETLALILRLMETNPNRVIYLRGNHESHGYWKQHSLKIELMIRAKHIAEDKKEPLCKEVNQFFDTLPLAVYLQQGDDFVRISPWSALDEKHKLVKESLYVNFLKKKSVGIAKFDLSNVQDTGEDLQLKVVIKSQKKREKFQLMDGLRLLPQERGATSWTLLASPTLPYQKLLKYFYDSFSIIEVGSKIGNWIITKYSRHVWKNPDFYSVSYSFLSGEQLTEEEVEKMRKGFLVKSMVERKKEEKPSKVESVVEKAVDEKGVKKGSLVDGEKVEMEDEEGFVFEDKSSDVKKEERVITSEVKMKGKYEVKQQEKEDEEEGFEPDVEEFDPLSDN